MCGIFGALQIGEKPITISTVKALATEAERRGKDSWGMAWIDEYGRIHSFKSEGKVTEDLRLLNILRDAKAVIGHTRKATHGDLSNLNNHPHMSDGGWIVHNGQIPNHQELVDDHGLMPITECDSEVLALMIQNRPGRSTLLRGVVRAVNACERTYPLAMAGLWGRPSRAVLVRRGNPLEVATGASGNVYFGSYSPKRWLTSTTKRERRAVAGLKFAPMEDSTAIHINITTGDTSKLELREWIDTGARIKGSTDGGPLWSDELEDPRCDRGCDFDLDDSWRWTGKTWVYRGDPRDKTAVEKYLAMQAAKG